MNKILNSKPQQLPQAKPVEPRTEPKAEPRPVIVNHNKSKPKPFEEQKKPVANPKQDELDAQLIAQLLEEDESRMLAEQLQ